MEESVTATNAYASIKLHGKTFSNNSIWHRWQDVILPEFEAYLGIILSMAIIDKPNIKVYFSREWLEAQPFFVSIFSRRRFLQIHWKLHLKLHNQTLFESPEEAKFKTLQPTCKKCLELYMPHQKIAVDESTVGYKGRIFFKTYNFQKPTKWGLRVIVLAKCRTGYICSFQPYFGKQITENLPWPDQSFTSRILLHLVDQVTALHKALDIIYIPIDITPVCP